MKLSGRMRDGKMHQVWPSLHRTKAGLLYNRRNRFKSRIQRGNTND